MNHNTLITACPRDDIAAFIDGELTEGQKADLERHVSECAICSRSLMEQRQFMAALSASLDSSSVLPLPKDFAKKVVVSAESSVVGIREPGELHTALYLCFALFVFAVLASGIESFGLGSPLAAIGEKMFAFGLLIIKLINSVAFAAVVVLGSLASRFDAIGVATAVGLVFGAVVLVFSTRKVMRSKNA